MKKLIKPAFLQKKKYADLVLLLQLLILLVVAICLAISFKNGNYYSFITSTSYKSYEQAIFESDVNLIIIVDLVFAVLSSWQNEKINLSQTWNLIPVSGSKLWWSNILSSIFSCVYLFILQLFILLFTALLCGCQFNPVRATLNAFGFWPGKSSWQLVIWRLLFLLLTAGFIYIFVSLIHFSSQVIITYLPVKNTLWLRMFVIALLVIIALYFGSIFAGHFNNFINQYYHRVQVRVDPLSWDDLILFGADFIFSLCDLGLFNKFVEARADQ